jgi:hypothetical protein
MYKKDYKPTKDIGKKYNGLKLNNSFVNILLGKINMNISWSLNEKTKIRILNSLYKRKNKAYNGIYKMPQIGYQGCSLNIPPDSIYVYNNIIINKGKGVLEIYADKKRSFEKKILKTAPKNTIPDIVKEFEL